MFSKEPTEPILELIAGAEQVQVGFLFDRIEWMPLSELLLQTAFCQCLTASTVGNVFLKSAPLDKLRENSCCVNY